MRKWLFLMGIIHSAAQKKTQGEKIKTRRDFVRLLRFVTFVCEKR